MPEPAHPLVVRFGRLGDMLLLQPLLHRVRHRHALPCHLLTRGIWSAPLYGSHADVARLTELTRPHRPYLLSPERWRAVKALRELPPVPVYVAEREPRALDKVRALLARAGIPDAHCRYAIDVPMRADEHWIDYLLRFGEQTPPAFGGSRMAAEGPVGQAAPQPAAPHLELTVEDRADLATWLQTRGLASHPLILVQPANKRTRRRFGFRATEEDDKAWPAERWGQLVRQMRARAPDARVLVCGSGEERVYAERIREAASMDGVVSVAGDLPLRRFMALAGIAHSMVSVDTGPAHLAAAMGCPLVVLFGRVSPSVWIPRSRLGSSVVALGGPARGGRVDALGVDEVAAHWCELTGRSA